MLKVVKKCTNLNGLNNKTKSSGVKCWKGNGKRNSELARNNSYRSQLEGYPT